MHIMSGGTIYRERQSYVEIVVSTNLVFGHLSSTKRKTCPHIPNVSIDTLLCVQLKRKRKEKRRLEKRMHVVRVLTFTYQL